MSLDTKYRPQTYADVIGQDGTVRILRNFVGRGSGFHQSYLLGGAWGSGKTTLARILARSLLCESPVDGEACGACSSCLSLMEGGTSECLVEVDAATNSGKESISRIVEDSRYGTFSGKRKIYIFDECHELSKSAQDAMLLLLEDVVPGSEDKKLVCIFCTTEPEKMRPAILSRCAPAFTVRAATPDQIADRLSEIGTKEGIEYERDALVLIAEATECHIRDALKALEGVSMSGKVGRSSVLSYLHMDATGLYLDALMALGTDLQAATISLTSALESVSPATVYKSLADLAMLSYRVGILEVGNVPSFIDRNKLIELSKYHGDFLVEIGSTFAKAPSRSSSSALFCDLASLHLLKTGRVTAVVSTHTPVASRAPPPVNVEPKIEGPSQGAPEPAGENKVNPDVHSADNVGKVQSKKYVTSTGVYVDEGALHSRNESPVGGSLPPLSPDQFSFALNRRLQELADEHAGSPRQDHLGGA